MLSVDEIRALGEVHPEIKPILESGSPLLQAWRHDTDTKQVQAAMLSMIQAQQKPDPATIPHVEEHIQIPVRDGSKIAARIYKPKEISSDGSPGFIVFHGGGYAVGGLETEAWLCALFTSLGGVTVNVDYRLAPDHPFPTAINDAFDATKWVAANAQSLGINPAKGLIVGGESSGSDMALIVSHLCRDDHMSPPLTGTYAAAPSGANKDLIPLKYRDHFISFDQHVNAPVLTTESLEFIQKNYGSIPGDPRAWPIAFPDHSGLPKTYFQMCGLDPARDCGLVMEQMWNDAGVATKKDIYPGMPHVFWGFFPELKSTTKHFEDSKAGLQWLLKDWQGRNKVAL